MIRIIAAGKLKDRRLADLIAEYGRRIGGLAPFEFVEVKDSDPEREAEAMLRRLGSPQGSGLVVALDEHGEDITSENLAALLGAHGTVSFLVGGADGLGQAVRQRADRTLRLSSLTLTHEMARLLASEQVYRALTILRNQPYHRR
ncbi:MAG: 23S rRNA (pseudouridine(1915)-N(3))-methyltransferase RlmH [bacterium]